MVISKKDKSFILFLASAAILLWFLFIAVSYAASIISLKSSNTLNPIASINNQERWFNVSHKLSEKDLKGRVILLDFWTYSCVRCLQNLPNIKELEDRFGSKILVIGVHSGKFANEKDPQTIRDAIIKYNISHPVIDDSNLEIFNSFNIESLPTLVLINPKGRVEETYQGQVDPKELTKKIKKLIKKHRFILNNEPLPLILEKGLPTRNILNFPSKIEYAKNFKYKNRRIDALIIANSGDNNIIISSLDGKILEEIGSKKAGLEDGSFTQAKFHYPTGLLYKNDILYVADSANNALRKVDFKTKKVSTIIGSGKQGNILDKEQNIADFDLALPWDLKYFPDQNNIIIANSGTNQLLKYNIKKQKIMPFAGNGTRDMIDGSYPNNSLAQPVSLSSKEGRLYFIDSYSSSLRFADKKGHIKTLIGQGLEYFGNKNGKKSQALMQNPLGLYAAKEFIYIADSYNHMIRRYGYDSKKMFNYSGDGTKSDNIGSKISYNEPADIILIKNKFYIVDSHNNRIIIKNKSNKKTSILDILPPLRVPKTGLLEYLPNLDILEEKTISSDSIIDLDISIKDGWIINEMAPSFFNLVEVVDQDKASLIATYDWNMIQSGNIKLPKMSQKNQYYLQGTVYYCEDKKNALCFIHSYESKIKPDQKSTTKQISILVQ